MRLAEDFRSIARNALNGKWKIAVLVGLVATLLGAVEDMGPKVKINIDASSADASFEFAGQTIFSTGGGLNSDIGAFLVGSFTYIMIDLEENSFGKFISTDKCNFVIPVQREGKIVQNLFPIDGFG